ncbi:unnamed protein product [Meloidogyne enterolobii]|uniref:Uncharacterized protein n=1 Tax=Meloidogyne enterolobii TaxID=390850 RepID=A0ACB0YBD7_MELEN
MFNQQGNSNQDKNEHLISMSKQNQQQNLNNESYANENFFVHPHQQQHNFYPTPTSLSSSLGHKRQLTEEHLNQEEKVEEWNM